MKKTLLLVALFAGLGAANAQTTKGTWLLGGDLSANFTSDKQKVGSTTNDGNSNTEFLLTPRIGYFAIDKLAIGAELEYVYLSTTDNNANNRIGGTGKLTDSQNIFLIGPFARYYFPINADWAVFGHGAVTFGSSNSKNQRFNPDGTVATTDDPSHGLLNFEIGPGIAYFMNPKIALEASVLYVSRRDKYTPTGSLENTTTTTSGMNLHIGFQIHFGK